jgi:hypothetical protein
MGFRDLNPEDERSLATFALAVRAALPAIPDPALTRNVVPELAAAAATGERAAARSAPAVRVAPIPRRRPRFAIAARIAFAVALLPALFAGMAVAGVSLPQAAQDAFEAVGVELPNQDDSSSTGGDDPAGGRTIGPAPGESTGNGAGLDKSNPARLRGRGNGEQGRGRALGKRGIPPGHDKSQGNNAGGNGKGKAIGKSDGTPPGQAKVKPTPPAVPPGQEKKGDQAQQNAGSGNGPSNSNAGGNGGGKGPVDRTLRALLQ